MDNLDRAVLGLIFAAAVGLAATMVLLEDKEIIPHVIAAVLIL